MVRLSGREKSKMCGYPLTGRKVRDDPEEGGEEEESLQVASRNATGTCTYSIALV
jgi:hypothetical protein